jgi:DNA-binding MarR family transcriptional regulator
VTRQLGVLQEGGWVQSTAATADARVRTVALSREGRQLVSRAKRVAWPRIEAAVAEACAAPRGGSLLAQLGALEDALEASPLVRRAFGERRPPTRRP